MNRERRFTRLALAGLKLQSRDDKQPVISGYGAVFYRDDDPGTEYELFEGLVERIMPGAFDRAIQEADDCRALFNHNPDLCLGRSTAGTLRLSIDATGLRYEIDPPDTAAGRDVQVSLQRGDITGSSFTFLPDDMTWREKDGVTIREVRSVQLFDLGPVTFPAYTSSTAGMRSAGDEGEEVRQAAERWKAEQGTALQAALSEYRARAARVLS